MNRAVNNEVNINNGKSVAALFAEMKQELQDFVQTRVTMFKVELQEKVRVVKAAAPLAVIGAVLLLTAYLLLTLALVALVFALLPDNAYRWCIAFAAIGVLWLILGGIAAYMAKRELEVKGLLPKRTVEVLKEDKMWIQTEVKQI
ncbi:MAG: phage holin family protein [Candidatus Sulfotelmatobacter sp.]|jgi:uncharacterized membrane protein YqjE